MAKDEKQEEIPKKKVFLCYARENQTLMDDFYNRFKNYNEAKFEILYDRHAESRNMHEVFNEFARQCDVAILLVNARFINPNSYASQFEVPVLLERKEANEVVVVGIRFSNVSDLAEWNSEGDVYFFSPTNNDLPYTRSLKPDDLAFHKEFAVYIQVDDKDRDMFHDKLYQWIIQCLQKRENVDNTINAKFENESQGNFRNTSMLENALIDMKSTSLLYKLEKKLSIDKSFWDSAQISIPSEGEKWAFWYLFRQADKLEDLQTTLCQLTPEDPLTKFNSKLEQIEQSILLLIIFLENNEKEDEERLDYELEKNLKKVMNALDAASVKMIEGPRKHHTEVKSSVIDAVESLRSFLKTLAGISLGGS